MKRAIVPIAFIMILAILGAYMITNEYQKRNKKVSEETPVAEEVVSLDDLQTADTVVLLSKNLTDKTLQVRHIGTLEDYELAFDGTVPFLNKYGTTMTPSELTNGEILDVVYSKRNSKVISVKVSAKTWTMTNMTDYEIDANRKMMTIMGEAYQFGSDLMTYSDDEPVRLMDITNIDTLTIKGYNRKVCSVMVEKGHGYLRIQNDAYFIGGWIEVGQKIIRPITEEMLLPVPEGRYKVKVTNRGYAGEENVVIERDKETILDLSKIEVEEVAIGHVQFDLSPEYAQLYVDDEITDYDERVPLEYGTHKIRVEAAGFETVETNIKIGNDYANVEIALDPLPEDEESTEETKKAPVIPSTELNNNTEESSENTENTPNTVPEQTTANTENTTTADTNSITGAKKIYVQQPVDAEVYLDGNYIGVAPISTNKVTGSHTITLSRSGYYTKSYTIYVENDNNDVNLSFSDLIAE
ncbi:MAG: PEGA domain-containing protein [Lachnospiraceae bacterium]|nr:PEGA domain-containing protein [Lachnospiraceae bacterium]